MCGSTADNCFCFIKNKSTTPTLETATLNVVFVIHLAFLCLVLAK